MRTLFGEAGPGPKETWAAVVVASPGWDKRAVTAAERAVRSAGGALGFRVATALAEDQVVAAVAPRDDEGRAGPKGLRVLGAAILTEIDRAVGGAPSVGMGGTLPGPAGLVMSYREAREALQLGRRLWRSPRAVLFEDVIAGISLSTDPALARRLSSVLSPLVAHDRGNRPRLLPTLEAFFDAGLRAGAAARRLRVHRHTVTHRILLIEELLGRSVRSGPDRLLLELALWARRLLAGARD